MFRSVFFVLRVSFLRFAWQATKGTGDASEFVKTYEKNYAKTEGKGLICIPSGNHDMSRISQRLDKKEIKLAFSFILTMPGAPFIYYGDEIGMRHLEGAKSVEGGFERTASRSPMQWNSSVNAGFSAADPEDLYIPIDSDVNRPTVEKAVNDPDSIYNEVRKLIELRQAHSALKSNGKIEFLYAEKNAYPLVYRRYDDNESIIVAINPSSNAASCRISGLNIKEILYTNGDAADITDGVLTVPAESVSVFSV